MTEFNILYNLASSPIVELVVFIFFLTNFAFPLSRGNVVELTGSRQTS